MTPMDVCFRKINVGEFDRLKPLFPCEERFWLPYRHTRLAQMANHETDIYVVEHPAGDLIGEISAEYVSHALTEEAIPGKRAYFSAFRLAEPFQAQGLGQGLLSYAISDLGAHGYTEFTVGVEEENAAAKHIYRKFGFTQAIAYGHGGELDPCEYTLYLKTTNSVE